MKPAAPAQCYELHIELTSDQPIANQLADQLTWMIASGQITTGGKLPAVRVLARQLGINLHTVRAAYRKLEESRLVLTRQGGGSIVLPFDPLHHMESAPAARSHTIGLIVPDLANPFYPAIFRGAETIAKQEHTLLITCDTQEDVVMGKEYLDLLIAKRVDGLIIAPQGLRLGGCTPDRGISQLHCPVPIVYVDRPEELGYSVLLDAAGAGRQATEHLIQHGHQRVALITGSTDVPTLRQCFLGYQGALDDHGLACDPEDIIEVDAFSFEAGYRAAQALLDLPVFPRAVFAAGDLLAIGAIRAFRDRGLSVPGEVAVVGYNDIETAAYIDPPLTTVAVSAFELGSASMKMLIRLLKKEVLSEERITLPARLVVRQSCGCPGAEKGRSNSQMFISKTTLV